MNVFISWSGELSKKIAEILSRKIPCVIQSVSVFVSSTDIEKGENWDSRITTELSQAKFGIVCLTSENIDAPWVHFEAGAISQTLDSKVSALMINVNPSDMQGPLKRFQATKFDQTDFFSLLKSINESLEAPISIEVLTDSFEMAWPSIMSEMKKALSEHPKKDGKKENKTDPPNSIAIEEILDLSRRQYQLLSSGALFSQGYLEDMLMRIGDRQNPTRDDQSLRISLNNIIEQFDNWIDYVKYTLTPKQDKYLLESILDLGQEILTIIKFNGCQIADIHVDRLKQNLSLLRKEINKKQKE